MPREGAIIFDDLIGKLEVPNRASGAAARGATASDRVIENYDAARKLFAWSKDKRRPCTYDLGSRRLPGRNTVPS
jgi:hypothetical protein